MKIFVTTIAALSLVGAFAAGGALAKTITHPPTDAQLKAFYVKCVRIGGAEDATLCKCKADAAPKLIDATFMDVVINAMGSSLNPKYNTAYNDYIARSNKICKPSYM
jgi:hypothetical protein